MVIVSCTMPQLCLLLLGLNGGTCSMTNSYPVNISRLSDGYINQAGFYEGTKS